MSVQLYEYVETSQVEFEKFVRWFQNNINLRDWDITLDIGPDAPEKTYGELEAVSPAVCIPEYQFLRANIWLSPDRCEEYNIHPIEVLCHELLHVLFSMMEYVSDSWNDDAEDLIITRLEGIITKAYFTEIDHTNIPKYQDRT